jgi:L-rhamnonate dehydratase
MRAMYDATDYVGRRGVAMHAIGGIDIASGTSPVRPPASPSASYSAASGTIVCRLPAYGTINPMARTHAGVSRQVEDAMRMNLKNIKSAAHPWWLDDVPLTTSLLKAARKTLGSAAITLTRLGSRRR